MPHPETFYVDIFTSAYACLSNSKQEDKATFEDLLLNNLVKFFTRVLKSNEEKNSGKKYVG